MKRRSQHLRLGKPSYFRLNAYLLPCLVIIFTLCTNMVSSANLSVPAEFVMRLQPPGTNNDFLRPADIFIDKQNGEVFIADPGKNRILIFDSSGTFRFEFEGAEYFSSPVNIVVDSEGFIFVLGSTREGRRVMKFDFDGLFIKELSLPQHSDGYTSDYTCLSIDTNDILYLFEQQAKQICSFDGDGNLLNSFKILADLDERARRELVISSITVNNNIIYIPVSSMGRILTFDLNGKKLRSIGRQGNKAGELNFPVKVKITNNNLLMVLDKHRINVVCYSSESKFLGEFGGKGSSPGWFYHPTLLETNNKNQVYIGQIYENKIQLCQIPQFIIEKNNALEEILKSEKGEDNVF